MNRTVAAALALLAVLSLGAPAATLDTATAGGSGGAGGGDTESVGSGGSFSFGGYNVSDTDTVTPPRLPPIVGQLLGIVLLLFFGLGLLQFMREHGVRGLLTVGLVGVVLVGGPWLLLNGLGATDGLFQQGQGGFGSGGTPELPGGASQGPEDASSPLTDPPALLFGLFGVVLLGALALIVRSTGDDLSQPDPSEESTGPTDVAAVARAAGRAADRIEERDGFDNEVYRAWDEMTRHLDVPNPDAATPAEFAAAAVDAGMAREDVDALTDVFELVRYGAADATDAREREAVDALRRIERAYADAEATDHGSGEPA